jgi:hypothetical protein
MKKINKLLEENALMRRIMMGSVLAAVILCILLGIVCFIWMANKSIWWLIGAIVCGMLAGAFGGTLFHLGVLEEES